MNILENGESPAAQPVVQKAAHLMRPSPSYSMTLRIEYGNAVGMMGRITSVIGEAGGDVGAIDIVSGTRETTTRDITFSAADYEHGQAIIAAVRNVEGVDIVQVSDRVFLLHIGGKLDITPKVPLKTRDDLSMAYTPGVARIAQAIAEEPGDAYNLTIKKNCVAVISDGSALLGLGTSARWRRFQSWKARRCCLKNSRASTRFLCALMCKTTTNSWLP